DEDRYPPSHVEILLDQAADLLDRCLKDRAEWNTLFEKWFRNQLELYEFYKIDEIQDEELAAGAFRVVGALSNDESEALRAEKAELEEVVKALKTLQGITLTPERREKYLHARVAEAWINMYVANSSPRIGNVGEKGFNIEENAPVNHVVSAARTLSEW